MPFVGLQKNEKEKGKENYLSARENIKMEKRQARNWEKIFAKYLIKHSPPKDTKNS